MYLSVNADEVDYPVVIKLLILCDVLDQHFWKITLKISYTMMSYSVRQSPTAHCFFLYKFVRKKQWLVGKWLSGILMTI